MRRPEWIPQPVWLDALEDLEALTGGWDQQQRDRLRQRFEQHALQGDPPIAAITRALSDLLEGDD